jgi:two-component system, cell cycle sensor histidine kinase and response regulator CckA
MPLMDPNILGKLLLIQSTLHIIPDDEGISAFICRGLSEIPGVQAIGTCLNGSFNQGNLPLSLCGTDIFKQHCLSCKTRIAGSGDMLGFCVAWGAEPASCIELRTASRLYGFLLVLKSDTDAYSLYEPFLQSTANLVALLLENRQQHAELVGIRDSLEQLVKQRTQELIRSNAHLRKEIQRHELTTSALQRSEELQRTTLLSLGDAVISTDAAGKVVTMNPVAVNLTGWAIVEAIGRPLSDVFKIVNAETGKTRRNPVDLVMETRGIVGLANHTMLISRDGSTYQIADSAAPIINDRGETTGVVLVFHDITKEYTMRQALQESEERYSAVVKQASEGIYLLDPHTKQILESNDAFKKMIGYQDTIAPDLFAYDFVAHERDEIDRIIQTVVSQKTWFVGERKYRHRNGSLFDVDASAKLIRFGGKEALCVIVRDITERKKAEEEREKLEERLQQSQKMEAIGTLAGGIAHDFNNILSAIIGYSELVKIELPPESRAAHDIDQIVRSGMRAADLVQQILAFSRKTDRSLQVVAPHIIVREVMRMLKATFPATVSIEEDIDEECGFVQVDPTGLHQILLNLCTNAFQALNDQKGLIRVRLYRLNGYDGEATDRNDAIDGPAVVLSVADSGCGMDRETMDRIFEPYFTTKEIGAGTGLGLAVVHGIVHDYKGHISVESMPGKGSTFTVMIPAVTKHPDISTDVSSGSEKVTLPKTVQGKILFVDDEIALCKLCKRILENIGYTVTTTTDSREALEHLRQQPDFDLVVTDQTMPGLTGIELAREILGIHPLMPIIMCTGHSDVVSEVDALAAGVKRYVFKPFQKKEFLAAIRDVMGAQGKG